MRIRALSVFEGVIYHCWPVDASDPARPKLEVDALLRAGDADAESGPLLLTVHDYAAMVGDAAVARACVDQLRAQGRIVDFLGADHISFPMWTRLDIETGQDLGPPPDAARGDDVLDTER